MQAYIFLSKLQKFIPLPLRASIVNLFLDLLPISIKGRKTLELFGKDIDKLDFNNANLFNYNMRNKLFKDSSELKRVISKEKIILKDLVRSITFEDYSNYLPEDILVKVNGRSIKTVDDLRKALRKQRSKWKISIKRGNKILRTEIPG